MGNNNLTYLNKKPLGWLVSGLLLLLAVGVFLLAIELVSASVLVLGQETVESILLVTSNPFIGLFIGLLATALIQSSSTVTSMTVAVVASGSLSLGNAIPIVMGANIGTTLTSTLVSLGFITNKNEFRKAISAGTIHDFFNIFTVLIVFPLEYYYGTVSYCAKQLTAFAVQGDGNGFLNNGMDVGYSRVTDALLTILPQNFLLVIIALVFLFFSIKFLSSIIYSRLIGASKDKLKKFVFSNPYKSFGWGTLITAGVQSSSITTSLIVPLVASGRVKLNNSFPFIMGANIGTTITALLAAFNRSDAAISLAFVHLLFNLIGVLIFLPFPAIRRIPTLVAYRFGKLTLDSRIFGFSYIIFSFFLLPFALIYMNRGTSEQQSYKYEVHYDYGVKVANETILVNRAKNEGIVQYLLFADKDHDGSGLPDTSFSIAQSQSKFVGPRGVFSYDLNRRTFQEEGKIISVSDTSQYSLNDQTIRDLQLIEVQLDNDRKGFFLINPKEKIIIESQFLDRNGKLIESSKLLSVQ